MYPHVTQFETVERFAREQLLLRESTTRRTQASPWWRRQVGGPTLIRRITTFLAQANLARYVDDETR